MDKYDVSVIVATFNPEKKKLLTTLSSIKNQKELRFEIIIADDCSECSSYNMLQESVSDIYAPVKIILNPDNLGTVKNILNAMQHATGKYVYLISPCDLLYDEYTLRDCFRYCEKENGGFLFGKAINYTLTDSKLLLSINRSPRNPELYWSDSSFKQKTAFFFGNWILGASYFRERELAIHYISAISECCRYAEDSTSTAMYLLDGNLLHYIDRPVVWYEFGSGISTSKNNKWYEILNQEYDAVYKLLYQNYSNDRVFCAGYEYHFSDKGKKYKLKRLFKHPFVSGILFLRHFFKYKDDWLNVAVESIKIQKILDSVK